ncbi:MAG: TonB family protein [Planctomycetes bacterium]|nr:TonB family protein [Planctomycetota bacterium]
MTGSADDTTLRMTFTAHTLQPRRPVAGRAALAAALLHGAALLAAHFIPATSPAPRRDPQWEDGPVFQLDLRSSLALDPEAQGEVEEPSGSGDGLAPDVALLPEVPAPFAETPAPLPEAPAPLVELVEPDAPPDEPAPELPTPVEATTAFDVDASTRADADLDVPPASENGAAASETLEPERSVDATVAAASPANSSTTGAPETTRAALGPTPSGGPPPPAVSAATAHVDTTGDRGRFASSGAAGPGGARASNADGPVELAAGSLRTRRAPKPDYPEGARRRSEQGTVTCRLTLDREGFVLEVALVTSSGHRELDDAAVRTLKRWRFEPIQELTNAKRAYALQRLTFELARP